MGASCSCGAIVPKYQQHVLALYPDPRSPDEMRTLGGVLAQDDVSKWKLRVSASELVGYCQTFPAKLAPTAAFIAKRIRGDLSRGRLRAAAIGMLILHALVAGAHDGEQLSLYEASVLSSMLLCFQHANTELQILAAQLLCTLLQVQEPAAAKAARLGSGSHGVDTYAAAYSGVDYTKYALFYPYVLSMSTRNPPPSKLASMTAQAKDLFLDARERAEREAREKDKGRKRVKDLAELEEQRQAHLREKEREKDRENGHAQQVQAQEEAKSIVAGASGASAAASGDESSSSTSSMLKLHISLWRSRYFGLKALDHLLQLNREWSASLSRLEEIVPVLLTNLPKSKPQMRTVAKEVAEGTAISQVDESYKHVSDDKEKSAGAAAGEPHVVLPPQSFKEELAARTGITLHHVQLLAYSAFRSLCHVPGLTLHLPALLGCMCTWFDQHQRTVVKTSLNGTVHKELVIAPADGSAAPSSASASVDSAPFAWENLFFTSHVFVDLLCAHVPFEGGSIDLLLLALMQHIQDIDDAAARGGAPGLSRRNSKQYEDGAATPSSRAEVESGATTVAPVSTAPLSTGGKSSLAHDFKQLFQRKKGAQHISSSRHAKLAQIAIVQLLNSILSQVGGLVNPASRGDDDENDDGSAGPASLCLMNFQILLDQLLTLLMGAVRASEAAHKSVQTLAHAAGGLSSGAGGDAEVLEAERASEAGVEYTDAYLRLLSSVFPSLLIQKLYSFNDILQAITLTLQLALARPTARTIKSALLDAAYSMSLGLLRWGCDSADDNTHRAIGLSPLSERANEARGRGVGPLLSPARGRNNTVGGGFGGEDASSNLSSSSLYEALLHAILGCIACESAPEVRGQAYKILQSVLMSMSGFGGAWSAYPSSASVALLLHSAAAAGAMGSFNPASINSFAHKQLQRSSSSNLVQQDAQASALNLDVPADDRNEKSVASTADPDASPTPTNAQRNNGANGFSSNGGRTQKDLRAQRIPQILASCMDIQSQIHTAAGSSNVAKNQRGSNVGGVTLAAARAGVCSANPASTVSLQDHKWILSVIYYELTACFSAPVEAQPSASPAVTGINAAAPGELSVDPSSTRAGAGSGSGESSAFQLASTILRPRGRGVTTDDNAALCFQLLILLLLQRHPSLASGEGGASDLGTMQQILALQLPLQFSLLSYLRSSSEEEQFNLSAASALRLHQFVHTYLFFVSKLLLMSIDSQWVRQQSVALEEMLRSVTQQRAANKEGLGGEQQASFLFGLDEVTSPTHRAQQSSASSALVAAAPSPIRTMIDPEQLAGILARLLVDPPAESSSIASVAGAASAAPAASPSAGGASSSSMHDPSLDEATDENIADQRAYLLDANSFEPFALKFLLPERTRAGTSRFNFRGVLGGLGGDLERETSVSWAPSAMGGGEGPSADDALATGRAGVFFANGLSLPDGHEDGHATPRQQYSPALRSTKANPLGSPLTPFNLPSATHHHGGSSSGSAGSSLSAVPQSPHAQQSVAEMMAELDQLSFHTLANTCMKTSCKSGDDFRMFMAELEGSAPTHARKTSDRHVQAQTPAQASTTSLEQLLGLPSLDEGVSACDSLPDRSVMQPLAPSTLQLQFPQLASFDLYLHSEIE